MKTFVAICLSMLFAVELLGCSTTTQPVPPAQFVSPLPVDLKDVESVMVSSSIGWVLHINADGSAGIQFGSTAGDHAFLPKGTCDFTAVIAEVMRQRSESVVWGSTSAGLNIKGKTTVLSSLKDDTYFRALIASVSDKWERKGWRFDQLREKHPIYPPADTAGRR